METTLALQYLPANAAWMILWNGQRIAGPMETAPLGQWLRDHGITPQEISAPLWMQKEWEALSPILGTRNA
jgi:hypothetical protein